MKASSFPSVRSELLRGMCVISAVFGLLGGISLPFSFFGGVLAVIGCTVYLLVGLSFLAGGQALNERQWWGRPLIAVTSLTLSILSGSMAVHANQNTDSGSVCWFGSVSTYFAVLFILALLPERHPQPVAGDPTDGHVEQYVAPKPPIETF